IPKLIADDGDDAIPDLRQLYKTNPTAKHIIDLAAAIEGVPRHASTHAAGIIVGDRPLVEYLPLHRPTKGDTENSPVKMVTQFPMETAESIGLLKIDFLGLSTLTILRRACELVERYHGIRYDMSNIPIKPDPNDPEITRRVAETFEMIGRGETIGVFQIESSGMRQMLTDMRPQTFEHIIAAISLYRPGPMDQIPTFNRRLHGEEAPQYHHEKLKPILENTFGILVYQEQIMQVASDLFGYSLADADLMRRAVSKKKEEELLKHRQIFIENGPKHGVNAETSAQIFADIEFFARYGFNKCVVGDTQILDATTGRRLRVADLFAQPGLMQQTVALDTDTWRLTEGTVTDVMANGVKSVYRLRTRLGKQIEATANHPFLTFEGWRWLGDLQPGDRIATPRRIPVEGAQEWPAHQINVLGYLLAEGNLCHPHGVYFYTGEDDQCAQYVQNLECFANTRATVAHRRGMAEVYSRRAAREHPAEVVTWLEDLGLRGKTAHQKFIPPAVFELTNAQIGILLARMWEGNGHVNLDSRNLYYATASEQLARDMQHLLLRFGIISRLREVIFPYKEGPMGYQVFITGMPNIAAFARHIGQHFITPTRRERLAALQIDVPFKSGTRDTLPMGVKALVHEAKTASGLSWTAIGAATGLSITPFNRQASDAKQAFKRETIAQLATFFEDENLHAHAHSDVYWDTVESIEYIGEQPTYDLTVAGLHNFIADDIIVHNSHAADYAVITCQTAYLKCHYPHEYMSALMSVYYDDSTKVGLFIADCIRMGIKVLPPDVNRSFADFSIEEDHVGGRHIRFGLGAIKNLGQAAIQYLITQRGDTPFADLDDFLKRCEVREVGKRGLEALIKVGALDEISQSSGKNRADVLANLENISRYNAEHFKNAAIGQVSMFDLLGSNDGNSSGSVTSVILAAPPKEWTAREQLRWEKELVGIYVSGHPLTPYWEVMVRGISHTIAEVHEAAPTIERKAVVTVGGLVVAVRTIITRKGDTMAFMTLEDLTGKLDVVVFPEVWANHGPRIMEDEIFLVRGHVEIRGTDVQLQAVTFLQQLDNNPVAESVSMFPKTHEKTDALLDEETGEMQSPTLVTAAANGHRAAHGNGFSPAGGVQQMTFASTAVDVTRTQRPLHDKEGEPHSGQEFTPRYPNEPTYAPDEWRETHEDVHRLKGNEAPARDFSPSESAPTPPPKEPKEPNDYAEFGQLQLRILIERAPDLERDRRRLREIYGYVSQFPGPHKFIVAYMALNSGEGKYLDFAETQIMIHDAMVEGLFLLEGVIDVQVRDLDQRGK
ncbi:MAG: LAGLIDADG family homing endonuclease, partial [Anaerolineales bacterium]